LKGAYWRRNGVTLREKYETLKLGDLREIAKKRGIKGASGMKKSEIIDLMCELDEKEAAQATKKTAADDTKEVKEKTPGRKKRVVVATAASEDTTNAAPAKSAPAAKPAPAPKAEEKSAPEKKDAATDAEAQEIADGDSADGILEVMQDGYGFIRCENYLPGENDVYVAPSLIRKFNLKTGDILKGICRAKKENDKFAALLRLDTVNGYKPEVAMGRWDFEKMTPIFPNNKIRLEQPGCSVAMRIMDLISPIGKGQRGMIVSPPKAGKTTLLKDVAKSILKGNSDIHLIILLIDERPEEVTDIKESIEGPNAEVIYSTFDELPEHHKRVAEMVMERAKRLVEHGKDVVILLDSITRLTRAYNIVVPPSGRTLSGGLDPAALHMPKRFFGAARNMREGGSLTILATALIETGSKMDDVIYEEFKGTGNMEMVLDRKLQEKRIFPAINIPKSSTRREDLLLTAEEIAAINSLRKGFNSMKADEAVDQCINLFSKTRSNIEFVRMVEKQMRF
jgi:transcription termination factor Rho